MSVILSQIDINSMNVKPLHAITQTQTEGNMQKVSTIQQLDLSKISNDDWEKLGDAVMEVQHPGQAHEVMDQMMGGEGSESLRRMHIQMGKAYLGNNSSLKGGGFPMMGFGSMMGYGANSGAYGVLGGVTWIALIAFLVAGAYFFIKQASKK